MDDSEQIRIDDFLIDKDSFTRNALLLIVKMMEMMREGSGEVTALVDEILHSIFFLGKIQKLQFSPEDIVTDGEMLIKLKNRFPRAFDLYSSQLPKRGPFSCLLDMVVHLIGRDNEMGIRERLGEIIGELDLSQDLVSSTICVSHRDDTEDPVKYYGVSNSAPGSLPRKIMIAASCLGYWDSYVAGAVMTYFPSKQKDFDGTIQLPKRVMCQAFNLQMNEHMLPCRLCGNLFGLKPCENEEKECQWPYGNCAEVESLSNLFKGVDDFQVSARPTSKMYSDGAMLMLEERVRKDLINWLKSLKFTWKNTFYIPQRVSVLRT